MTMTEAELQDLLQKNPALHVRGDALRPKPPKIARPKPMFDSQAEERYYNAYIWTVCIARQGGSMQELRCKGKYKGKPCNRILLEADIEKGIIKEICSRCGTVNIFEFKRKDRA